MSRTFSSPLHTALVELLKERRLKAGLTQVDVAERLGRYQSFVTAYESGQKRIDVVELVQIAEAIGFDPADALRKINRK